MRYCLRTSLIALAAAAVVAGLWFTRSPSAPRAFCRAIHQEQQAALYEGLPHPNMERDVFASERKTRRTQRLNGHYFYHPTQNLRDFNVERLAAVLGDEKSFRAISGEKMCGGFHPDYALEYGSGAHRFLILLCFGCSEARVYGPGTNSPRYDLTRVAQNKLQELLRDHRQKRPTTNHFH